MSCCVSSAGIVSKLLLADQTPLLAKTRKTSMPISTFQILARNPGTSNKAYTLIGIAYRSHSESSFSFRRALFV
jgi:hypothetical protein